MSSTHTEHWLELKVPPILVFIIALAGVWLTDHVLPMSGLLAGSKTPLSLALLILGVASGVAGVVSFKLAKTTVHPIKINKTSVLVSSGLYRFSRNPMYLGMLLIIIGLVVGLENPYSFIWAVLFVVFMNRFQVLPEERALVKLFAEHYLHYQRKVRRWL